MPKLAPLLLETIKVENGSPQNIAYHQRRFDKSRKSLYPEAQRLLLSEQIEAPDSQLYRCRILYRKEIESIEYLPYHAREISTLRMVESSIDYRYKYADRTALNQLKEQYKSVDDILILKNGFVRDTTIANIAFYDGERWHTPSKPLLEGTMREKLLEQKILHRKEIHLEHLREFTHVALMNAMIGFKIQKNITIYDTEGKPYDD